jgi:deoxyribonuclease-4
MLGYHVGHGKGLYESITEAKQVLAKFDLHGFTPVFQFFVTGPQSQRPVHISDTEIEQMRLMGCAMIIHGAYVSNPWNKAPGAIHNLKQEMIMAERLGAAGCIVHTGKTENIEYVLGAMTSEPRPLGDRELSAPARLWLETHSAKPGPYTCETPEKINTLFKKLHSVAKRPQLGLCIDTAHVFACGVALDSAATTRQWLGALRVDCPIMFHLNDSKGKLGDGRDIHEAVGLGNIWKAYGPGGYLDPADSGYAAILQYARANSCMVILERSSDELAAEITRLVKCLN